MSVRSSGHRSSPRRGFSDYACVPAKNAGASPRLSATVRQRWLSLYHRGKYYRPAAAHGARYCPGLRRWPDGADNHSGAKGVYGVKQVIVVDRIAERLQMARENGADLTLDNTDQPLAEQLAQRQLAPRWSLMPPATRRSCRKPFSSPPRRPHRYTRFLRRGLDPHSAKHHQ